jgi:hypothetical protein
MVNLDTTASSLAPVFSYPFFIYPQLRYEVTQLFKTVT